jgi:hypothetical protein
MAEPPPMFDISILLQSGEDPTEAANALVDALAEEAPLEARGVRATDHGVVVDFPDMQAREGQELPSASEISRENLDRLLPVLKAMISLGAARVRAGLAPGERIVIDVRPSAVHGQEELRHT